MGTILKYWDETSGTWKPFLGDVPAPSNSIVSNNTPTGDIDGTNTVFTTGQPYIPGSLEVYVNGLLQVSGIHYTETNPATGEFTFDEAPLTGDNIVCNYMVANTATGNADTVDSFHASATPTPNTLLPLDADGKFSLLQVEAVAFRAVKNATQAVGNVAFAAQAFATEVYDIGGNYASNQFTAPFDGIYHFSGALGTNTSNTRLIVSLFNVGSNAEIARGSNSAGATMAGGGDSVLSVDLFLAAGTVVELRGFGSSAFSTTAEALRNWFAGHLVTRTV